MFRLVTKFKNRTSYFFANCLWFKGLIDFLGRDLSANSWIPSLQRILLELTPGHRITQISLLFLISKHLVYTKYFLVTISFLKGVHNPFWRNIYLKYWKKCLINIYTNIMFSNVLVLQWRFFICASLRTEKTDSVKITELGRAN